MATMIAVAVEGRLPANVDDTAGVTRRAQADGPSPVFPEHAVNRPEHLHRPGQHRVVRRVVVVDLALDAFERLADVVAIPQARAQQHDIVDTIARLEVLQRPDRHARAGRESDNVNRLARKLVAVILDRARQAQATQPRVPQPLVDGGIERDGPEDRGDLSLVAGSLKTFADAYIAKVEVSSTGAIERDPVLGLRSERGCTAD